MKTLPLLSLFSLLGAVIVSAAEPQAFVEVQSDYLIGAHVNGKWLKSDAAGKVVKPGTTFRLYSLTKELGNTKGGKPMASVDVCEDVCTVALSPKPEQAVIAVAAPWNAMPRAPKVMNTTQPVYIHAVREFLQDHGIREPKVKITRILRVDLEGDGEDEVLISATNYFKSDGVPTSASAGSYSFVMLRRVVAGKVQTQMVAGEIYTKAKVFNAPNEYQVSAILDLDGDGKLEVIVRSAYYEGDATSIYRCTPSKVEELVTVACGV